MYYLPVIQKYFVQDLYSQPELVPHLANDGPPDNEEPGSVRSSREWHRKVRSNPVMFDRRSLALIGTADGVPYFKDKTARNGVPVMLRVANLPDGLQLLSRNSHLTGLVPGDHWVWDADKSKCTRVSQKPKSLRAIQVLLADELYQLYTEGTSIIDKSVPKGVPGRVFKLRVLLLYWCVV